MMKKNSFEVRDHDIGKLSERLANVSPKPLLDSQGPKKLEKKNQIKTYNEFVRMVINEETKEKHSEFLSITPIKKSPPEHQPSLKFMIINDLKHKPKIDENVAIQKRKAFTPKGAKNSIEIHHGKNVQPFSFPVEKKEILNVTPIKEVVPIPEKKVLVRSFSKGNLIAPSQEPKNPLEINKNPRNSTSIAKKKIDTVSQNGQPPKPKRNEKNENENGVLEIHPVKNWNMSEEEKTMYGDRMVENYEKVDLLGKGGFAVVWLGLDKLANDRKVAVKQIAKSNSENCRKELYFGQLFFNEKGKPREEFDHYEGINYITQFLYHKITPKDLWMVFELGGHTLSKVLFEMKGEFFKGERVYHIKYSKFYEKLHSDISILQKFIRALAEALLLLADYKIVHSDLKPDNILMELNKGNDEFEKLKLIDFGSAYSFDEVGSISMATPEYMPPEVLELILNSNKYTGPHKSQIEALSEVSQPWSVDVWSMASIILEILVGIPHWISYKCKVTSKKGKEVLKTGLFAVKGRTYDKIIAKQRSLIENLEEKLEDCMDIRDQNNQRLCDLLLKMFEWNPKKRISPEEIVKHPFLNKNI